MTDRYVPTPLHPGQILVVDDLAGHRRMFQKQLSKEPFHLALAPSATEALALCACQPFEGILMDVSLPGLDGIEACRQLREDPAYGLNADTPLIFISSERVGEEWVSRGIEAGGLDYLVRPYSVTELVAKVRMMVRLSRQRQAALAGERHRALLEIAGGMAHELSQPLATAQVLLDQLINRPGPPGARQLADLRRCLADTTTVLRQIQNLHTYITKPYASGRILDLDQSSRSLLPAEPGADPLPGHSL